jgi:hypothetical protein
MDVSTDTTTAAAAAAAAAEQQEDAVAAADDDDELLCGSSDVWEEGELEKGMLHSLLELGHLEAALYQVPLPQISYCNSRVGAVSLAALSYQLLDYSMRLSKGDVLGYVSGLVV